MAKKRSTKTTKEQKKAYPPVFEMFKARMRREGREDELSTKYQFHRDFGMRHTQAMWTSIREMGYVDGQTERKHYDEHQLLGHNGAVRKMTLEQADAARLEEQLDELQKRSKDQKFDAVEGIEWVASVFHLKHVTPMQCPHIIAWNVLQTSKKYEVAFFKDFLMKALQKGVTAESTEEFAEDESQLADLRKAVSDAITG